VFDLLAVLLENPDRVISRDEVIERVWSGQIVSDSTIDARVSAARKAVGDSGAKQSLIKTLPRRGFRFIGSVQHSSDALVSATGRDIAVDQQTIQFCKSQDKTNIAFARSGSGPPLVRAGHWLTHLEHDWRSPIWGPFLKELGQSYSLVRYDQRGNGLSDWAIEDFSLDAFVVDFKAVVDAAGLDRFPILASSQGGPVSLAFAARYPERVTKLVLLGSFARGRLLRVDASEREQAEAYMTLMKHGWGVESSAFLKAFSAIYIPDGRADELESLAEQQRITASPENAVSLRYAFDNFDVSEILPKVKAPTLVMHARNDGVHPLDQGRELAANISDAELFVLESRNHVVLKHDAAWAPFFQALHQHLD
jgi:pimeloyl-ACP methyl ester carboxylesterase